MKPIANVGLFSQIASIVLWSAMASAQAAPAAAGAKGASDATTKGNSAATAKGASDATDKGTADAKAKGTSDAKGAAAAAPASSAPAEPATQPGVPSPAGAQPADAAATATEGATAEAAPEQAAAEGDVAGEKKDKKKKDKDKNKKKDKDSAEAAAAEAAAAEQQEDGNFIRDYMAGDPWGSTKGALRAKVLTFRFLAQPQYEQTFGVASKSTDAAYQVAEEDLAKSGDGWDLHRLFFGISAEPSKYLHLKMTTDFAELRKNNLQKAVKQAYVELRPFPKLLHINVGVVKLPFSTLELDSVAAYELNTMGRGNAFINKMDMIGRDIGMAITVTPLEKARYLRLTAGAYRGHANAEAASPVGTIGARIESEFLAGLRVGVGMISMPKDVVRLNALDTSGNDIVPNPANPTYPRAETWKKGNAFGADITFQHAGFMIRGEGMMGDRVDYDTRYGAEKWANAWGIIAYKFDAGPVKFEPAVRVEYLDTDTKRAAGAYRQFTFAVGTHFNSATKFIIDATRMIVEDNTPYVDQPKPLREIPFNALSATTVIARLQVAL